MTRLIKRQRIDNPDTGTSWLLTYVCGSLFELKSAREGWSTQGYKTSTGESGTSLQFTVLVTTFEDSPDDFKDNWNCRTETYSISIWKDAYIRKLMTSNIYAPDYTELEIFNFSKRDILACVNSKTYTPNLVTLVPGTSYTLTQGQLDIYNLIKGGASELPERRFVLLRRRTIPVGSINRVSIIGVRTIYTTNALIDIFQLPYDALNLIGDIDAGLPDAPLGYVWAWWLREDENEIVVGSGKAQENRSWVFALYPQKGYTLIP